MQCRDDAQVLFDSFNLVVRVEGSDSFNGKGVGNWAGGVDHTFEPTPMVDAS